MVNACQLLTSQTLGPCSCFFNVNVKSHNAQMLNPSIPSKSPPCPELRARAPRHRPQPAGRGARTADGPTGESGADLVEETDLTINCSLIFYILQTSL